MMEMEMRPCLDEFEKLLVRMNTPRVMIDNAGCVNATLVMIDSARKDGILLDAVQVLTDLNLLIKKGYVSSDGCWNMDVFHVTNLDGNKLTDDSIINCIQQSLGTIHHTRSKSIDGMTAIELTGTDRVGLLSEVFAVLSDLKCDVVESKVWTHNGRIASLIYLKDCESGCPINDSQKLESIEARLRNVLKGDNDIRSAKTSVSMAVTHTERRLHQMMFADRDYERTSVIKTSGECSPAVSVQNCLEKGYSVVNIQCKDRPKLLFDVVFTLSDMQYTVFHATIDTTDNGAYLEFFIRHTDGTAISSEAEKQRVTLCLKSAIERRASGGVRLELRKEDKPGLLAEVTRAFRENALNVTRAEISTTMGKAENIFYVTDAHGNHVDSKTIESVRQRIGLDYLRVKELPLAFRNNEKGENVEGGAVLLALGSLLRRNLSNLGGLIIKSYS
ncbi:putative [Protein-PII] uridylyltransferase [Helianthus annuus]|uniref:ACT domain-containing protein ACR n=1 Tax=Helianthus annuus TaxID=4232 RepID=A0A251UHQ8_HELAN|nr:ACT domain-containing protein ACR8 [Helianthus annuus]KAF5800691.1 putative [Protein-PII] uridylyltransferase [Helianthus annuus]KAJ0559081.1 putative [Protein-PII] uridylyltransferase [Helianthus annuus]KAJ0572028.1 putative [Protein-PII] uridylyltransferase [Helianthus annuus]KAJ0739434.1 putative [Protein-PII] uridylyltransferase [Helianthus annuus]KAJ0910113.1 putative [Protein-PII] uridylyltransferase [Helianthus annuus]